MRKVLYILGQLHDRDIEWLARVGERRRLSPRKVMIREGEPIDALYILLDGRMSVKVEGVGVVAEMGTGEIIGELSLVENGPASATVTAVEDCNLLAIAHDQLKARLDQDDAFGHRFYRALAMLLADRLRDRVKRVHYRDQGDLAGDDVLADELDEQLLDTVSLAGERFDRMLKMLAGRT
jgi:CRP/FNR family cyclic AMP-dependent transcriptional regulator